MIEKIGLWGSIASIISLVLVFLLPTRTADSQSNNSNQSVRIENTGPVGRDIIGIINNQTKYRNATILNNENSATLVIKSFPEDKDFIRHSKQKENLLGLAVVGTEVQVLETKETSHPMFKAKKIKILSGDLQGETGWVSANKVEEIKLPE